jgi:hypothetical protein
MIHRYLKYPRQGIVLFLSFLGMTLSTYGQPGGKAFQFLEVTNSAHAASLGGTIVAISDNDPDLVYHNPALLTTEMHHHMALNYVNYFAGINYGYASAAARLGAKSMLSGGIHYLNYGKFQGADETGQLTGTFRASDYSVNITLSRPIDSLLRLGVTVKSIFSDYEMYNSTALAFDAGITYTNPSMRFSAGLVMRNLGFQVDTYYPNQVHEPLPFNLALGLSQSLQYAPLTFFIVADHLEKWDLTYQTEADKENTGNSFTEDMAPESGFDIFVDKFMRHIIVGTEFKIGKNMALRAGYNYRRRQELKIDSKPGMVGFSWGIGLNVNKFRLSYGHAIYHLAGGVNYFSFSANLDEFSKKF